MCLDMKQPCIVSVHGSMYTSDSEYSLMDMNVYTNFIWLLQCHGCPTACGWNVLYDLVVHNIILLCLQPVFAKVSLCQYIANSNFCVVK